MTVDKRNLMSSSQLMVLIISAMTGTGIISLPYVLSQRAGHDGWIIILISGIIDIVMAALLLKLLMKHGDKSIFEINTLLYGKYAGTALNIVYLIYLSIKAAINLRITVEVIHIIVLRITPSIILTVLVMMSVVYASWYGWRVICRYANLIFATIFMVMILYAVMIPHMRLTFLMPVFNIGLTDMIESMKSIAFSFLGFAFPWIVYPMITDKEKALKGTILSLIVSTLFFMITIIVTTGYFGENMLRHILFPVYSLALAYRAPIFERIDLVFLVLWMPAFGMVVKAYFYTAYFWAFKLFIEKKMKLSTANKVRTLSLLLFSTAIIILSRIPKDYNQVLKYLGVTDLVGLPLIYGMAIIGYIASLIKGNKSKS